VIFSFFSLRVHEFLNSGNISLVMTKEVDYEKLFTHLHGKIGLFFEEKRDNPKWIKIKNEFRKKSLINQRNSIENCLPNSYQGNPFDEILAKLGITNYEVDNKVIFFELLEKMEKAYNKEKDHVLWWDILDEFWKYREMELEDENRN